MIQVATLALFKIFILDYSNLKIKERIPVSIIIFAKMEVNVIA